MTTQDNNRSNRDIVRDFVAHIENEQIRLMCFLWSRGYSDEDVKRKLKLTWPRLHELKAQVYDGLLAAGIKLRR